MRKSERLSRWLTGGSFVLMAGMLGSLIHSRAVAPEEAEVASHTGEVDLLQGTSIQRDEILLKLKKSYREKSN